MYVAFFKVLRPVLLYIVFTGIIVMSMFYSGEYCDKLAAWLYDKLVVSPPPTSTGLAVSVITILIGLVYVLATQNRTKQGMVRRYRWAELKLMELEIDKLKQGETLTGDSFRQDMVRYHGQFHWNTYAALGFQSVSLIVVLSAAEKIRAMLPVDQVGVFLGMALLGISTVVFGLTDFFHTNTLSPLVTSKRRMLLINVIVMLGGFSYLLQICSVGIFLALMNPWLSFITSITGLGLMVLITELRGVPINELEEERQLSEGEKAEVMNA